MRIGYKESGSELANLRVQLQAQLLNEHSVEAQLQSDLTEAKLQAERDEALQHEGIGSAMNAKISRARAESLVTRLQLEKESWRLRKRRGRHNCGEAGGSRAGAGFVRIKRHQKESLVVRAGISGILDEISVDAGQQISAGAIWRAYEFERFVARIHIRVASR